MTADSPMKVAPNSPPVHDSHDVRAMLELVGHGPLDPTRIARNTSIPRKYLMSRPTTAS